MAATTAAVAVVSVAVRCDSTGGGSGVARGYGAATDTDADRSIGASRAGGGGGSGDSSGSMVRLDRRRQWCCTPAVVSTDAGRIISFDSWRRRQWCRWQCDATEQAAAAVLLTTKARPLTLAPTEASASRAGGDGSGERQWGCGTTEQAAVALHLSSGLN